MEADFWVQRWQDNQIGFHQGQVNPWLIEYWPGLEIPADGRVLVPLAGKSLDMWWLRQQGHAVLGVELSPIAVAGFFDEAGIVPEHGRDGAFEYCSGDGVRLLCGDFFALGRDDLEGVAAVYDRASLVALPPAMRPGYVAHLLRILPPGCPILLITMEYPSEQMQGPPFAVAENEVRRLFDDHFVVEKLEEADILEQMPRFQQRGLTALTEKVFTLSAAL